MKDRYRHVNAIELELGPCNHLYNTAFVIFFRLVSCCNRCLRDCVKIGLLFADVFCLHFLLPCWCRQKFMIRVTVPDCLSISDVFMFHILVSSVYTFSIFRSSWKIIRQLPFCQRQVLGITISNVSWNIGNLSGFYTTYWTSCVWMFQRNMLCDGSFL